MLWNHADKLSAVPGIEKFIKFTKAAGNTAHSSGPIDRSGVIQIPFRTKVASPMPTYNLDFSMTYAECFLSRTTELISMSQSTGKKIRLFYSGGLDSTCILASFINLLGLSSAASLVELSCSKESMYENPYMWDKYIRPGNFKIVCSHDHAYQWNDHVINVQGDLNEHLFDPGTSHAGWPRFARLHNLDDNMTVEKLTDWKHWVSNYTQPKEDIRMWADTMMTICNSAPIAIDNLNLFSWYQGFNLSWNSNLVRLGLQSKNKQLPPDFTSNVLLQFFASPNFQQWSLKLHATDPTSFNNEYKKDCKELVLSLIDIPEFKSKQKFPSLPRIWGKRPTGCFIDSDFVVHTDPADFLDFIEPNNSFV
ncbi:MAG: hypothetical protein RLZZ196_3796 [Bacteroidota bacterium]|jgi:hypothetical protein